MYYDKKKSPWPLVAGISALLLGAVLIWFTLFADAGQDMNAGTETAIGDAIRRCAMQCYAIEGVYPESLDYMEENYGLRVNTRDYYVVYEVFAENLPPDIRVTKRTEGA